MTASGMLPDQAAAIASWLSDVVGLRTTGQRSDRIVAAIAEALDDADVPGPTFRAKAEHDPERFEDLIRRVTVGETSFFREPAHFDLLRDRILPELDAVRPASHTVRCWSAGCATGEEAYTLAIVLDQLGRLDRAAIVGTDISATALEQARAATYRPWSLRGIDDDVRGAYFRPQGGRFRLDRRLVDQVRFRQANLVDDEPVRADEPPFDVIFCRNVLIYLTPDAINRVVERLAAALAPDGWLVTASSDPDLSEHPDLTSVMHDRVVAYRRPGVPAPATDPRPVQPRGRPRLDPDARGRQWRDQRRPRTDAAAAGHRRRRPAAPGDLPTAADRPAHEIEYRRAVQLLDQGRWDEAARAARNALYLRPDLVVAEVALGRAAQARGDVDGATRAWRNALALLRRLDVDAPVPLGEGASVGRLVAELSALLDRSDEGGS